MKAPQIFLETQVDFERRGLFISVRGAVKAAIASNFGGFDSHTVHVGTDGDLIGFFGIHKTEKLDGHKLSGVINWVVPQLFKIPPICWEMALLQFKSY